MYHIFTLGGKIPHSLWSIFFWHLKPLPCLNMKFKCQLPYPCNSKVRFKISCLPNEARKQGLPWSLYLGVSGGLCLVWQPHLLNKPRISAAGVWMPQCPAQVQGEHTTCNRKPSFLSLGPSFLINSPLYILFLSLPLQPPHCPLLSTSVICFDPTLPCRADTMVCSIGEGTAIISPPQ